MEWGPQLETLLEVQEATGKIPKALQSRPSLDVRQKYYFGIFADLSGSRGRDQSGFLPVSVHELLAYCTFYGINDIEQRTTIARHISSLDSAYLKELDKKKDKERKS